MGSKLYDSEHVERYADDQFYAFTRGNMGEVRFSACTTIINLVNSPKIIRFLWQRAILDQDRP